MFSIYGLCYLLAIFAVYAYVSLEWRKKGYQFKYLEYLFIFVVAGGLIGGHWWYVIFDRPIEYIQDNGLWGAVFGIGSGRAIQGAIIFGILGGYIGIKAFDIPVKLLDATDIILPAVLLGQAIGRFGNFYNQEIYGAIMDPNSTMYDLLPNFVIEGMTIDGIVYQPLFLYEAVLDFTGFVLICFVLKNVTNLRKGSFTALYILYYSGVRMIMEPMRDPQFWMIWGDLDHFYIRTTETMAIIFFFVGLYMLIDFNTGYWERKGFSWSYERLQLYRRIVIGSSYNKKYIQGYEKCKTFKITENDVLSELRNHFKHKINIYEQDK